MDRCLRRVETLLDQLSEAKDAFAQAFREKEDADREHDITRRKYEAEVGLDKRSADNKKGDAVEEAATILGFGMDDKHPKTQEFEQKWKATLRGARRQERNHP